VFRLRHKRFGLLASPYYLKPVLTTNLPHRGTGIRTMITTKEDIEQRMKCTSMSAMRKTFREVIDHIPYLWMDARCTIYRMDLTVTMKTAESEVHCEPNLWAGPSFAAPDAAIVH
jgi:hypothetical protein